jgi:hypothetical protein
MTQQRIRRNGLVSALVAATFILAACGGDSSGDSSGDIGTDATSVDSSDLGSGSDILENMDGAAEMAGVPEECLEISMAMVGAMGVVGNDMTDTEALANVPAAFDAIRSKAPEELRGDIDIVKAGYANYLEILKRFDYDFAKLSADPAAVEEMSEAMNVEGFDEASERFNAWLDSVCGTQ